MPKGPQGQKTPAMDAKLEPAPDAWTRFERAVDAAVKSGPMHRSTKKKAKRANARKRAPSA
jgi:hypothetical protein